MGHHTMPVWNTGFDGTPIYALWWLRHRGECERKGV